MKSMTYAQKADLVAKCKRVFESVKRSNQVAMAEKYRALAVKAIGDDYSLGGSVDRSFKEMHSRIKNKPRYRYDNRAGEWVECKARNEYSASLNDCKIRERVNLMEEWTRLEMARARQGNPFSNRLGINPNIMNTSCYQIGAGVNPLTGW